MASFKKCIEQHCKNCTYDAAEPGTWRDQVENCTVRKCALWEVRPKTIATINANRTPRSIAEVNEEVDCEEEVA